MSVEAITWALQDAPGVPASCVSVLVGLADHANRNGRNAFPGVPRLAKYARKRQRQVQRDLDQLRAVGVIDYGNPAVTAHVRSDRRPQVYDLAMSTAARGVTQDVSCASEPAAPDVTDDTPQPAASLDPGVVGDIPQPVVPAVRDVAEDTPQPTIPAARGVTQDMSHTDHGVSCETERGVTQGTTGCHARHPNRHEPSMNHQKSAPRAGRRGRARATITPTDLAASAARPDAWQLVADWHNDQPVTHRTATRRALTKQIDGILRDQGDPAAARDALDAWADRSDARPGLVPYLYDDALKARHGARPRGRQTREDKVQAWFQFDPDDPGSQPYSAREDKVQAYLDPSLAEPDPAIESIAAGFAGSAQPARIASTATQDHPVRQLHQPADDDGPQRHTALVEGRSA